MFPLFYGKHMWTFWPTQYLEAQACPKSEKGKGRDRAIRNMQANLEMWQWRGNNQKSFFLFVCLFLVFPLLTIYMFRSGALQVLETVIFSLGESVSEL